MKDIVIYGYDRSHTEEIIDAYTKGIDEFSTMYISEGVHREDKLLCHLRLGCNGECPYIFMGRADIIRAKHWDDACRYFEWIRDDGKLVIDEDTGDGPMKDYLLKQEKAGFIKVVYPGKDMV